MDIKKEKERIRYYIWNLLEKRGVTKFPRPIVGRIPNFKGSELAAAKLSSLPIFKSAKVIKVNPDSPQIPVRFLALKYGKILIMPTPRIRQGFLLLDPAKIGFNKLKFASTIRGSFKYGKRIKPWDLPNIDLIVMGSVAVSLDGKRLGKGEGYGELEYAILREFNKVTNRTPIVTTIHDLQLVDEIPSEDHDVPVDVIITPNRIIEIKTKLPKPRGIIWDKLNEHKFNEIPLLLEVYRRVHLGR